MFIKQKSQLKERTRWQCSFAKMDLYSLLAIKSTLKSGIDLGTPWVIKEMRK